MTSHWILPALSIGLFAINIFVLTYVFAGLQRNPSTKAYFGLVFLMLVANIFAGIPHIYHLDPQAINNFLRFRSIIWCLATPTLLNYVYQLLGKRRDYLFWIFSLSAIAIIPVCFFTKLIIEDGFRADSLGHFANLGKFFTHWFIFITLLPLIHILKITYQKLKVSKISFSSPVNYTISIILVITLILIIRIGLTFFKLKNCIFFEIQMIATLLNLAIFLFYMKYGRNNFLRDQIQSSRQKLSDVMDTAGDVFWEMSLDMRISFVSERVVDLLGYTPSEFVGHTPFEFMEANEAQRMLLIQAEAFESRSPVLGQECEMLDKYGKKLVIVLNGIPIFDENGNVISFRGSCRDITAKKLLQRELLQNEARLRAILDNTDALIYIKDLDGRYLLINRRCEDLFHHSKDYVIGKSDYELHDKLYVDRIIANDRKVIESGLSLKCEEEIALHGERDVRTFITVKFPLKDIDGDIYAIGGISTDISDVKGAASEKEKLQTQLFQSSRLASIGLLAAGVAHEINNPMVVIQATADFIADELKLLDIKSEKLNKFLSMQNESIERITNIVSKLSYYAKKDSRNCEDVNVHDVVDRTLSILSTIYRNSDISVSKNFAQGHPIVNCKIGEFQQVLMNIFTNAKDAMEGRSDGNLSINTIIDDSTIIIKVRDNGHGIRKDNLSKVFDAFFTTKNTGQGTGLGLNISHSIITEMGGTITVKSKYEKWTEFIITLPLVANSTSFGFDQQLNRNQVMEKFSGNVLLVDDDKSVCDVLSSYLRSYGLVVSTTNRGRDALKKLQDFTYDLLITDLLMPEMSGRALLNQANSLGLLEATKVVVITGDISNDNSDIENELEIVDAKLTKPFSRDKLYQILKENL